MPIDTSQADTQTKTLLTGVKWASPVTYSFYNSGSEGLPPFTEAAMNNIRTIIEEVIEPLINVDFVEVPDSQDSYGDIRYMFSYDTAYAQAYAIYWGSNGDYPNIYQSGVQFNPDVTNNPNNLISSINSGPGNHGYTVIIHETLHALGLKHPGNYNGAGTGTGPFLPYGEDNQSNTVMSYNFPGFPVTSPASMMPYDIKALQYLYGAKANNASDSVYTFNSVYGYTLNG